MPLPRRLTGPAGPALLVATAALLAGCAQSGQLGHERGSADPAGTPEPAGTAAPAVPGDPDDGGGTEPGTPGTATVAPDEPASTSVPGTAPGSPVAQAGSDAQGTVDRPVEISTPGPAELLVRTEVLQPGEDTGWVRHPGTVISAVRSGTVTVQRAGSCGPADFGGGQAFFLGDGEPNLLRNDGPEPVVLTRSELLAPDTPERESVDPAC